MSAIDVIAIVFSVLVITKVLVLVYDRKILVWFVTNGFYKYKKSWTLILAALTVIVFYFIVQEMTLVQIGAAVLFGALMTSLVYMLYPKEATEFAKKVLSYKLSVAHIIYILIWIIIAVLVLYEALTV